MLKRELKINLKSLIIWTSILIILFLMVFLVYPYIMNNENKEMIDQMMMMFPEELIKSFNMDIASIESVFGWFKTEGYIFLLLVGGLYSSILGSSILLKEESDKTIEFLYSKPISKNKIVTSKILCGIINITILTFTITLFNLIGMAISNDLKLKSFLMLSLMPIFVYYSFFFISLLISTFFTKTRKITGIAIGIVFISYFLQIIGNLSDKLEIFKYLSLFELSSGRYIINNNKVNFLAIIIGLIIIAVTTFGTYYRYNKKELV